MGIVKKTIELDQEQINRIRVALKLKSEQEAINAVLKQFDTDIQLAEVTLKDAGTCQSMKTKLTKRGQTVVPYKIRRQFGLGESSMLEWMVEKDVITVLPIRKKRIPSLKGYLKGHFSFEAFMADRRADRVKEKA